MPLVPERPLPAELVALPKARVVGPWVNPSRLRAIREARAQHLGTTNPGTCTDLDAVKQEARAAHRIMTAHGWHTIDASCIAVEEIAREVMRLRGLAERSVG